MEWRKKAVYFLAIPLNVIQLITFTVLMGVRNMMKRILLLMLLFSGGVYSADAMQELAAGHVESEALLEKKVIRLSADGGAEMDLRSAEVLLEKSDLLLVVQQAYVDMLPDGMANEAVIRKTGESAYFYQNRKGRTTRVEEVRRRVEPGRVAVLYYAAGERFFGRFQVLAQVVLEEDHDGHCSYQVTVAAYPETSVIRWIGRSGIVSRFFRNKTDELIHLAVAVTDRIVETTLIVPDPVPRV